jgi:serine/threonine protein kinase
MKIDRENQRVVSVLDNEIIVINKISKFSHDNVVKFYEYFEEDDKAVFILEYCQHKTLDDLISN